VNGDWKLYTRCSTVELVWGVINEYIAGEGARFHPTCRLEIAGCSPSKSLTIPSLSVSACSPTYLLSLPSLLSTYFVLTPTQNGGAYSHLALRLISLEYEWVQFACLGMELRGPGLLASLVAAHNSTR